MGEQGICNALAGDSIPLPGYKAVENESHILSHR